MSDATKTRLADLQSLSEAELRDRIVVPLLSKMGYQGVRVQHGSRELGKDVVFFQEDPLAREHHYAVIVKGSSVSHSAMSANSLMTVLHQLKLSFDSPYTDSRNGREVNIDGAYLITVGTISKEAMNSCRAQLKSFRPAVTFIDGPALLDLLAKYCPDPLLFHEEPSPSAGSNKMEDSGTSALSSQTAVPENRTPAAFISYCWESPTHREWVLHFAERLQGEHGVRVILDRWHLLPGGDKTAFMEQSILEADFLLVICTPEYAKKSNQRAGGVGYESMVITGQLAHSVVQRKFIPVLREGDWTTSIPSWIQSKMGVDLRGNRYDEDQYELLLRVLHQAQLEPPPIAPRPAFLDSGRQRNSEVFKSMPATNVASKIDQGGAELIYGDLNRLATRMVEEIGQSKRIWVQGITLRNFFNDSPVAAALRSRLKAQDGADIRVILLDTDSEQARLMASDRVRLTGDLLTTVEILKSVRNAGGVLRARKSRMVPYRLLFIGDEAAFVEQYPLGSTHQPSHGSGNRVLATLPVIEYQRQINSKDAQRLEDTRGIRRESSFTPDSRGYSILVDHFEQAWEQSVEID